MKEIDLGRDELAIFKGYIVGCRWKRSGDGSDRMGKQEVGSWMASLVAIGELSMISSIESKSSIPERWELRIGSKKIKHDGVCGFCPMYEL